jgi:urease accessory protein UreH
MAFELPDGKGIFVLDELDVKAIAKTFWAEVIATDMTRVLMLHDHGFDRANKLYEVYAKEQGQMSKAMKEDCLKTIIKYLSENDFELITLKDKIALSEKSKK